MSLVFQSGMSAGMYALRPVFDLDAVVEHPACVYRLPVIQSSKAIESAGAAGVVAGGPVAGGAVAALAARQEAILEPPTRPRAPGP